MRAAVAVSAPGPTGPGRRSGGPAGPGRESTGRERAAPASRSPPPTPPARPHRPPEGLRPDAVRRGRRQPVRTPPSPPQLRRHLVVERLMLGPSRHAVLPPPNPQHTHRPRTARALPLPAGWFLFGVVGCKEEREGRQEVFSSRPVY